MTRHPALLRALLPACLLLAPAAPLYAQLEGTLFTSPEQRAYMDFLRQDFLARSQDAGFNIEVPEIPEVPVEVTEEVAVAEPVEFTFGGIMTSRDGTRSVWLNNQLLQESDLPGWARIVTANPGLALQLDANGSRWLLKPGQTVDITSGTIVEEYQRPEPEGAPATGLAALVDAIMPETSAGDTAIDPAPETEVPVEATVDSTTVAPGDTQTLSLEDLSDEELEEIIRALQDARQAPANVSP